MPNITIDEAIEVLTTEIRRNLGDDTDKLLAVFNEVFPDAPRTGDTTLDSNSLIEQLIVHVNSGIEFAEFLDLWRLIYDFAENRLHFNELDEMQFLAMWLHVAAMETGQLRVARRLIGEAWKGVVEMYGLPDENDPELPRDIDPHDPFEIPRIIGTFAFHWDEADRMQRAADEARGSFYRGYRLVESLDAGMSEAYIAEHTETGNRVFLKRVHTSSTDKSALERELRIYDKLMRLHISHVAEILEFFRDDEYIGLVTEFADSGDLQAFVERHETGRGLSSAVAKKIATNIAVALKALHSNEIVHRDLKPRNVLNFGGTWKLGDFGIAKNRTRLLTEKTFRPCGTRGYAPPEQFQGAEAQPSADIYSLGKIVIFLLTGQTDIDLVPYSRWADLAKRCISIKPEDRPVVDEVIRTLEDIPV